MAEIEVEPDGHFSAGGIRFDQATDLSNVNLFGVLFNKRRGEGQWLDILMPGWTSPARLLYIDGQWYRSVPDPAQNQTNIAPTERPRFAFIQAMVGAVLLITAVATLALGGIKGVLNPSSTGALLFAIGASSVLLAMTKTTRTEVARDSGYFLGRTGAVASWCIAPSIITGVAAYLDVYEPTLMNHLTMFGTVFGVLQLYKGSGKLHRPAQNH